VSGRNASGKAEEPADPLPEAEAELKKYLDAFVKGLSYRKRPALEDLPEAEYLDESEETGCCAACGKTDAVAIPLFRGLTCVRLTRWPRWCLCRGCLPLALVNDHYGVLRLLVRSWDGDVEAEVAGPEIAALCQGGKVVRCPTCQRPLLAVTHWYQHASGFREGCCTGHLRSPSNDARSRERLEAREGRTCKHCGRPFTPKNALGRTCSTRCRVALHRQRQAEAPKRRRKK
jgi:hypothetical protein